DAFLRLHKKTKNDKFLALAQQAGDDLLKNQLSNGIFLNSHFEANPSLGRGSTPHDTAAALGLAYLARYLREKGTKYLLAAKKNLDNYHFNFLYDKKTGIFRQYHYDKQNLHVPNKIATLIELLLMIYDLTKEQKYYEVVIANAEYILQHQDTTTMAGGIYQTEKHKHIISIYTARCIPALLKVYAITKDKKYLRAAQQAGVFLKKMRNAKGGYDFGYLKTEKGWKRFKYPIFIAGSADITRALFLLGEKKIVERDIQWLIRHQLPTGGFMTSYGMNLKNKDQTYIGKPCWRDILPVVGWNDKVLRLLSELLPSKVTILEEEGKFPCEIKCADGTYNESVEAMYVQSKKKYVFDKRKQFSAYNDFYAALMRKAIPFVGTRTDRFLDIKVIDYLLKRGLTTKK
ncbi:MAG: hypothetical protein AABX72_01340, partial [Nanoarchaeota archaeon]